MFEGTGVKAGEKQLQRWFNRMLKKGFPVLFQLASSRSEFATACEH